MIPFYLSVAAFSCLGFAGAEPFHIPLVRTSTPPTMGSYIAAAEALKAKYNYNNPSTSKRRDTAAIPIVDQVSRFSAREILIRFRQ